MNLPLVITPGAERDIDEDADWYRKRSVQAAHLFTKRVKDAFARIEENPLIFEEVEPGIRCAPVHKHPHGIYFRIEEYSITVLSVFHEKREPRNWRRRG